MGRTRVFIYEHVTAGGMLAEPGAILPPSLAREGQAMRDAVVADFALLPNVEVRAMHDARVPPCYRGESGRLQNATWIEVARNDAAETTFLNEAAAADYTLVIAPETGGVLLDRCRAVLEAGGKLLGPSLEFVAIGSDKHLTAERLAKAGAPVPRGVAVSPGDEWPVGFHFPAVLKPRDGAGSQGVRLIERDADLAGIVVDLPMRLEEFISAWPASVAAICGPAGDVLLPPCWQHLSTDGTFAYLSGSLPIPEPLEARAHALAKRALAAMPPRLGWIGIDLALGVCPDGSGDAIIEVNPRLTTSYVGLRNANIGNLALVMLDAARGNVAPTGRNRTPTAWDADGTIRDAWQLR